MLLCDRCNDSQWLTQQEGSGYRVSCQGRVLSFEEPRSRFFAEMKFCDREFFLPAGFYFVSTIKVPKFLQERVAKLPLTD